MKPDSQQTDAAPVEEVGGTQESGLWPDGVANVEKGKTYRREVELDDGSTVEADVTVTGITEFVGPDGEPNGGYAVAYTFDNPNLDGGV